MSVKRVVFIRPGETEWNKIGRWQGIVAVPLNMHGIAQAKRLAEFVRNIQLDMIYSSNLRRAKDTAAVLSEYTHVPFHYDERLCERDMGLWQGLSTNEIRDWYKVPYEQLIADPHNIVVPSGESRAQVSARVNACFQDVISQGGETVGIISHTTAIRTLLAELVPSSDPYNILFHNMSVTTIARDDDGVWSISQLDDVTHLEGMKSTAFSGKIG